MLLSEEDSKWSQSTSPFLIADNSCIEILQNITVHWFHQIFSWLAKLFLVPAVSLSHGPFFFTWLVCRPLLGKGQQAKASSPTYQNKSLMLEVLKHLFGCTAVSCTITKTAQKDYSGNVHSEKQCKMLSHYSTMWKPQTFFFFLYTVKKNKGIWQLKRNRQESLYSFR